MLTPMQRAGASETDLGPYMHTKKRYMHTYTRRFGDGHTSTQRFGDVSGMGTLTRNVSQMQRAGASETDLRAKLQASLTAPKARPHPKFLRSRPRSRPVNNGALPGPVRFVPGNVVHDYKA